MIAARSSIHPHRGSHRGSERALFGLKESTATGNADRCRAIGLGLGRVPAEFRRAGMMAAAVGGAVDTMDTSLASGSGDSGPSTSTKMSLAAIAAHDMAFDAIVSGADPSAHITAHSQVHGWLDRIHPAGKTLLRCAVDSRQHVTITALIVAGASPLTADLYGKTPLHAACKNGDDAAVKAILDASTLTPLRTSRLLGAADQEGSTPLHAAAESGSSGAIELLLRASASVDSVDGIGSTPLHVASESGRAAAVGVLIAAGAEADRRNSLGNTPLHRAARRGLADAVEILCTHGADPTARNEEGLTPLDLAKKAARAEGLVHSCD
eukprot:m.214575 g.214575  ORF g.214575 m.214575 type:complete len:324 (-) comp25586_c1_seq2:142-1113(-)